MCDGDSEDGVCLMVVVVYCELFCLVNMCMIQSATYRAMTAVTGGARQLTMVVSLILFVNQRQRHCTCECHRCP